MGKWLGEAGRVGYSEEEERKHIEMDDEEKAARRLSRGRYMIHEKEEGWMKIREDTLQPILT